MMRVLAQLVAFVAICAAACASQEPTANKTDPQKTPRRIVSQLPSLTEICFELGLGDRVVGVTDYCLYPPEAKTRPKIGGLHNPKFEQIVSLRPDIILLQDKQENFVAKYEALGMRAMTVSTDTVSDVIGSIETLGQVFDRAEPARALVGSIRADFQALQDRTRDLSPVPTLVVIGHDPGSLQGLYVAAKGSFHDELLVAAGGINVIDDNSSFYPPITKDVIVERNPQVILELINETSLTPKQIADRVHLWDALPTVNAVREKRVRVLVGDHLLIPGPRMARAAMEIFTALHETSSETKP